jgi:predicted nucleic acid-binding protein
VKLFFDINVVLDVLTGRKPWAADSAAALSLLDVDEIQGLIAAHTVTTLHYLTFRHLPPGKANAGVLEVLGMCAIAAVDEATLLKALTVTAPDYEDAVQAVCAINEGADYFITRNTKDFAGLGLQVLTPAELLALLRSAEQ